MLSMRIIKSQFARKQRKLIILYAPQIKPTNRNKYVAVRIINFLSELKNSPTYFKRFWVIFPWCTQFCSNIFLQVQFVSVYNEFDQVDISIDVRNMTRTEILTQLDKSKTEQSSCYFEKWATETLKRTLRKSICVSHPIHKFLENLPKDQIKLIHS